MLNEKQILNRIACGVIVLDHKRRVSYVNDWVLTASGLSRKILLGSTISKILPDYAAAIEKDLNYMTTHEEQFINSATGMRMRVYITSQNFSHGTDLVSTCLSILPSLNSKVCFSDTNEIEPQERDRFFGLVGKSSHMQEIYGLIEMAAASDANVIIAGESGTGKELVASAIHHGSLRHDKEFVRVNCASLTETLLESELFGHAKGAFTGAFQDHIGKFEFANHGTIFLDEIGEISPAMQAKLLHVLQERVVVHVGDNREIKIDVRVVTATNKNLRALVTKGKFREDLFYRLNVFPIHVPPLRERHTDLPLLIQHFIEKFNIRTGKQIVSCSPDVMRILMAYCWPGNVRELENTIEHAFVLCRKTDIQVVDLPHELRVAAVREGICAERVAGIAQTFHPLPISKHLPGNRLSLSRETIERELTKQNGNKTATAKVLGISKVGLWKRMKKLGMM